MSSNRLNFALSRLRQATVGTKYDGKLWLVGGYVRDKLLHLPSDRDDIDIVLEMDAAELTAYIDSLGLADHTPVIYPRFGTAMVTISGVNVELVTARRESYAAGSRKPTSVEPATLAEDARRRDFTLNTLIENLHTGETADPLGVGLRDLRNKIIRTPLAPEDTFADDPLRMLRAVRFSARFNFEIEEATWHAIHKRSERLTSTVSAERIRDEFNKILSNVNAVEGIEMLRTSTLLEQFAPELTVMSGVTQNEFHCYDVWDHTLKALSHLIHVEEESPLLLRLAVLLHDCGKPATRSVGSDGRIHFYTHQDVGAKIVRVLLNRLKFSHSDIDTVSTLVALHMRIGEYRPHEWSSAAVRRFVRAAGSYLDWLFAIHRADVSALDLQYQDISHAVHLRRRIDDLEAVTQSREMDSPLSGSEIMTALGLTPGPEIGAIKNALADAVIDGRLDQFDKDGAKDLALELHSIVSH